MSEERWLPAGYELDDGNHIMSLYVRGPAWQLYTTQESGHALAVDEALHETWVEGDWIEDGVFAPGGVDGRSLYILSGRPGYLLSSMEYGPYPHSRGEALSFVQALRKTRERMGKQPLGDALYIEQFSRLLPTFTDAKPQTDEFVLGKWLSGGVNISVCSAEKLRELAPYLTATDIDRILSSMGLSKSGGSTAQVIGTSEDPEILPRHTGERRVRQYEFTLPGRPQLETFFREEIIDVIYRESEYRRMGIGFPAATLLYGPTGCGKTYAIEQLVKYLDLPVYYLDSGNVGSKYIHETSRKIAEIFDKAIENAPSCIVIDEMEAFVSSREQAHTSGEAHMEEVAEFLRKIPEATEKRVLIFGMTNLPDSIDKAILRRGRFDHMIEVGMPSPEEIKSLIDHILEPLPTEDGLDLTKLIAALQNCPVSDITFALRQAGRVAVRTGKQKIDQACIDQVCATFTSRTSREKHIGFGN